MESTKTDSWYMPILAIISILAMLGLVILSYLVIKWTPIYPWDVWRDFWQLIEELLEVGLWVGK